MSSDIERRRLALLDKYVSPPWKSPHPKPHFDKDIWTIRGADKLAEYVDWHKRHPHCTTPRKISAADNNDKQIRTSYTDDDDPSREYFDSGFTAPPISQEYLPPEFGKDGDLSTVYKTAVELEREQFCIAFSEYKNDDPWYTRSVKDNLEDNHSDGLHSPNGLFISPIIRTKENSKQYIRDPKFIDYDLPEIKETPIDFQTAVEQNKEMHAKMTVKEAGGSQNAEKKVKVSPWEERKVWSIFTEKGTAMDEWNQHRLERVIREGRLMYDETIIQDDFMGKKDMDRFKDIASRGTSRGSNILDEQEDFEDLTVKEKANRVFTYVLDKLGFDYKSKKSGNEKSTDADAVESKVVDSPVKSKSPVTSPKKKKKTKKIYTGSSDSKKNKDAASIESIMAGENVSFLNEKNNFSMHFDMENNSALHSDSSVMIGSVASMGSVPSIGSVVNGSNNDDEESVISQISNDSFFDDIDNNPVLRAIVDPSFTQDPNTLPPANTDDGIEYSKLTFDQRVELLKTKLGGDDVVAVMQQKWIKYAEKIRKQTKREKNYFDFSLNLHEACDRGNVTQAFAILKSDEADPNMIVDVDKPLFVYIFNKLIALDTQFGSINTDDKIEVDQRNYQLILELLLKHGANIDGTSGEGWAAIHYATTAMNARLVQWLIEHKATIDLPTIREKFTPLTIASKSGYINVIAVLLLNKYNINEVDRNKRMCLHHAALAGQTKTCLFLLKVLGGHARSLKDKYGKTPSNLSEENGFDDTSEKMMCFVDEIITIAPQMDYVKKKFEESQKKKTEGKTLEGVFNDITQGISNFFKGFM